MLILTRHIGESLIIGDNIKVVVLSIDGKQVRIGIDAPKNISIDREEIREIKNNNPGYYDDKIAARKLKNENRNG